MLNVVIGYSESAVLRADARRQFVRERKRLAVEFRGRIANERAAADEGAAWSPIPVS